MTLSSWKRPLTVAALLVAPVITVPVIAEGAAFAMPAAAEVQKAVALFKKASELYGNKKYAPALDHFRQSYALVPSPNSHLYIARCVAFLGDPRSAWLEYDRTIDEAAAGGAKYAATRDTAVQERDDLGSRLALVTAVVQNPDPAMTLHIGAHEVPADRWGKPFPVEPGNADVIVQAPGKPAVRAAATVGAGERRDVAVNTLGAAPTAPVGPVEPPVTTTPRRGLNPLRLSAFVAGGVGVVGFALFAAGGALSKGTYNSLNTLCSGQAGCPNGNRATADADISSGKSQQALANAGVVIGVVGVAAGATLFVLSMRKKQSDAGPTADLVVGPTGAFAVGTF